MIELTTGKTFNMPKIYVIGVGGGGNNAVNRMIADGVGNVEYISANTDAQVLEESNAGRTIQIGPKSTAGFGAGANPAVGAAAAKESEEEISEAVKDAQMVILTCGMGGGTGTGAIPVIASICKEEGILTVAVVTLPFSFEGQPKYLMAKEGLEELKKNVDTLLVIPNDKLLTITDKPFYLEEAFIMADSVLKYTILGLTNIIFNRGTINLDFNDIKTVLSDKGNAHLGIGRVSSEKSILEAVKQAVDSPLLETSIAGASHILLNSSGRINVLELNEAVNYVKEVAGPDVIIIWGTVTDKAADMDEIVVTLVATGIGDASEKKIVLAKTSKSDGNIRHGLDIPEFLKRVY